MLQFNHKAQVIRGKTNSPRDVFCGFLIGDFFRSRFFLGFSCCFFSSPLETLLRIRFTASGVVNMLGSNVLRFISRFPGGRGLEEGYNENFLIFPYTN